jgi:hypothetical protein
MAPRMARDGAVWRAGGMTFEFWTLVLNYRRRPQSDVVVVATCIILNLQFFATCMKVPWTYLSVAATSGSQSNGCRPRVKCLMQTMTSNERGLWLITKFLFYFYFNNRVLFYFYCSGALVCNFTYLNGSQRNLIIRYFILFFILFHQISTWKIWFRPTQTIFHGRGQVIDTQLSHVSHGDWVPPRVGFLHAFQKGASMAKAPSQ